MLDEVSADRPVIVRNTSEHAVWLNTAAMKLAGLNDYPLEDSYEEKGVIGTRAAARAVYFLKPRLGSPTGSPTRC
jgi:predicted amidohydrolase YtcJ